MAIRMGFAVVMGLGMVSACSGGNGSSSGTVYCTIPIVDAGGTVSTDPNVVPVTVDPGSDYYTNGLFASVTLCVPGTTTCQTFDRMLVDTGSAGVRVLESELTLTLPAVTSTSGAALAECTAFVDSTAWGPVKTADVIIGGETASSLSIQLIGEESFTIPSACTGTPITNRKTLGANGILGVGSTLQDCGQSCARPASTGLPYFACASATACSEVAVPVAQQVSHPVAAFPVDNNGVIITLPSLPEGGAFSLSGQLVFGIGTQTNNGLGAANVFPLNNVGFVSTTFPVGDTVRYTASIDSGSNGLYFLNSETSGLATCTGNLKDFYCPSATTSLSATISASNGASAQVDFRVASAAKLDACSFAFDDLAGPMPGYPTIPGFDWGLPFFFGRSVYTAIEGRTTPGGTGPYFAF